MNRIPAAFLPALPEELQLYTRDSNLFDSSCSEAARVWFSDRDEGYYIKSAPKGTLKQEADMAGYYHGLGFGPQVAAYLSWETDWMVTVALPGEDCLYPAYLDDPGRLSETLGQLLRMLHSTDTSHCPVQNRNESYISSAIHNHDASLRPVNENAWAIVQANLDCLDSRVLLHGDYCLPNVILKDWNFSGFIDVGFGGVGDRHMDLYWGCWSILYNLKEARWCSRFLDAYGREAVDTEKLRILDAFEAFG